MGFNGFNGIQRIEWGYYEIIIGIYWDDNDDCDGSDGNKNGIQYPMVSSDMAGWESLCKWRF